MWPFKTIRHASTFENIFVGLLIFVLVFIIKYRRILFGSYLAVLRKIVLVHERPTTFVLIHENNTSAGASIPPTTKALFPNSPLFHSLPLPLVLPSIPLLPRSGPLETS